MTLRARRQYHDLAQHIVAAQRTDIVNTLLAIDEFLAANRRLCMWLRDEVGAGISQTIDQSYLTDDLGLYIGETLGVFSEDVTLLDEVVQERTAIVTFSIRSRVAAQRAYLRRVDDRWQLAPRTTVTRQHIEAFRDMARGLDELLDELRTGLLPANVVRNDPQKLIDATRLSLRRGVRLLSKAAVASQPAPSPGRSAP